MFGFYTAFVVNVIKCRSKYKKYSKRIPTSKTGKMRKIPGPGQHWQQRLSSGGFRPKPLDPPSFCLFLHFNQNIDSLYFEAYQFLKVYEERFFVNSLESPQASCVCLSLKFPNESKCAVFFSALRHL